MTGGNKTKIAIFDLDKTLLHGSSVFIFGKCAVSAGLIKRKDIIKFAYENFRFKRRGENLLKLSDIQDKALCLCKGAALKDIDTLIEGKFKKKILKKIYKNAIFEIQKFNKTAIATSAPKIIARHIAAWLKIDDVIATELEVLDGYLTGRVIGDILHGEHKAAAVKNYLKQNNTDPKNAAFYSDAYADKPILDHVGEPRPCNPDARLRLHAKKRGWEITKF